MGGICEPRKSVARPARYTGSFSLTLLVVLLVPAFGLWPPWACGENLVFNGSFEKTTNRGIPDGYGWQLGWKDQVRYPDLTLADFGVSDRAAHHGKLCMQTSRGIYLKPHVAPLKRGTTYTFSVYVKAEAPDSPVMIGSMWGKANKKFQIGTEWQRIHTTFEAPLREPMVVNWSKTAHVWWDAAQVEEGAEPTPFAISRADVRATAQAKEKGPYVYNREHGSPFWEGVLPRVQFTVEATPRAPKIDGVLDDACWKSRRTIYIPGEDEAKKETTGTTAMIAYDDAAVYFAITCHEPEMSSILANYQNDDEYVCADDCLELFIDPRNEFRTYYHFMLNNLGAKAEDRLVEWMWNGSWDAAVTKHADRWIAEIAVPYLSLGGYDVSEAMGINICRSRSHAGEYIPWSGTAAIGYHRPWRFPEVRGFNPRPLRLRPRPLAITLSEKSGLLEVSCPVRNMDEKPVWLRPELMVRLDGSPAKKLFAAEARGIPGGNEVAFSFQVPFSSRNRSLRAQAFSYSRSGVKVLWSDEQAIRLPELIGGPGPDYELYTDDREMKCGFDLRNVRKLKGAALKLEVKDLFGKSWWAARQAIAQDSCRLSVPLAGLSHGAFRLEATAVQVDAGAAAKKPVEVIKRAYPFRKLPHPGKGTVVRVNRHRRCVMVDGRPFVGFGTTCTAKFPPEIRRPILAGYRSQGLNCVMLWNAGSRFHTEGRGIALDNLGVCLDLLEEHGIKASVHLGDFLNVRRTWAGNLERLEHLSELVKRFRSHPALLNWDLLDEPNASQQKERVETAYRLVREFDPYHPVTLNVNDDAARFIPWSAVSDIPSIDYYPLTALPAGRTAVVAAGMEKLAPYRPLRFWLQSFGSSSERRFREPTPRELLAMAYMVAAHGGNIFLYFCYRPMSPDLLDMWGQINRECLQLEGALTAAHREAVGISPEGAPILASLRVVGKEATLLTVNKSEQTQKVTMASGKGVRASVAEVVFEDREVALENGRITDTFEPLERHVYRLRMGE